MITFYSTTELIVGFLGLCMLAAGLSMVALRPEHPSEPILP